MKIIDRYIRRTVVAGSLLVWLILTLLSGFFVFIDQLEDLSGNYTVIKAIEYMVFILPGKAYVLFHTSILLGTLLSMGHLASSSELVILRAAGVSVARITWSVMKAGLILMLAGLFIGEVLAPSAEQYAQELRITTQSASKSIRSGQGLWSKNKQNFAQIGRVYPDARLAGITIYSFDKKYHLSSMIKATSASYSKDKWNLNDVTRTAFKSSSFSQKHFDTLEWGMLVQPEMLDSISVKPMDMSMLSLFRYVQYLEDNQLDSSRYELAFWMKVVKPFSALIMLLIAMPFVFGSLRSSSTGLRLLVGILLGLGFHMLNEALNYIGVGYGFNPVISAFLPSILFAVGGFLALRKVI